MMPGNAVWCEIFPSYIPPTNGLITALEPSLLRKLGFLSAKKLLFCLCAFRLWSLERVSPVQTSAPSSYTHTTSLHLRTGRRDIPTTKKYVLHVISHRSGRRNPVNSNEGIYSKLVNTTVPGMRTGFAREGQLGIYKGRHNHTLVLVSFC